MAALSTKRWAGLLGFALGGFFDGILLHQILQWHHLLSLVPGAADLRFQVLWDGYFHALMYALALVALLGLWRAHRRGALAGGKQLTSALLVGFGLWHVVDAIASHWVLGIHRVKLDSSNPLIWDLLWLLAFGVLPIVIGLMMARTPAPPGRTSVSLLLVMLVAVGAGVWSLLPPPSQPFVTVVFAPGTQPATVSQSLLAADARLIWSDAGMGVVVVQASPKRRWHFYRHGALLVGGTGLPAGCLDWARL